MPLQIRLRHPSGERVLDLPDRDAHSPLVVGRAANADVQVSSDSVAPRHAILFIDQGQWVTRGQGGTIQLNGEPLEFAASLQVGDVIALGTDAEAPTIEIDPAGQSKGRHGPVMAAADRTPLPASTLRDASSTSSEAAVDPEDEEPGDGDTIAWDPQTPVPSTSEFYIPKGRQTPVAVILGVVILGLAVLGGAGYLAYQRSRQPAKVIVLQQPDESPATPTAAPPRKTLFDANGDQAPARDGHDSAAPIPVPQPTASDPGTGSSASVPSPSEPPPTAAAAPAKFAAANDASPPAPEEAPPDPSDPEWREIANAHFNVRHQGVAIIKFDQYRLLHPGRYKSLLDQYTDDAVNWLYWQRVLQLWNRRDDLTAQSNQKKHDIQSQPAGAFRAQLEKDKAALDGRIADTTKLLTDEMGYTSDEPPDLENPRQLRKLSAARDPSKYAEFKKHVLRYVRDHHGSAWWEGE